MMPATADRDADLLLLLQRGLPLRPRPFARLGRAVRLTEDEVVARVAALLETGVARRLGAVFESRGLGYDSTLAAADVPEDKLPAAAARIVPATEVTHCYVRDGRPNLWFTVTAPAARLRAAVERLTDQLAPWPAFDMPARRTFKIGVVLDPRAAAGLPPASSASSVRPARRRPPPAPLDARERAIVRRLQGSLPVTTAPFACLAAELATTEAELLARLRAWQRSGVLRRVALVLRHRAVGFRANAMCAWSVADDRLAAAGAALARSPLITHCYERAPHPRFPCNLFAMLHAGTPPAARSAVAALAAGAGLDGGRLLFSTQELKKTSPSFFLEDAS
jgi:DNA-binding Lrp family transcriptional regulator